MIAFGGGSGLDVGKAIAFMSGQSLSLWDFEDIGDNWKKASLEKAKSELNNAISNKSASESKLDDFTLYLKKLSGNLEDKKALYKSLYRTYAPGGISPTMKQIMKKTKPFVSNAVNGAT